MCRKVTMGAETSLFFLGPSSHKVADPGAKMPAQYPTIFIDIDWFCSFAKSDLEPAKISNIPIYQQLYDTSYQQSPTIPTRQMYVAAKDSFTAAVPQIRDIGVGVDAAVRRPLWAYFCYIVAIRACFYEIRGFL